jgi:hypothetical protein
MRTGILKAVAPALLACLAALVLAACGSGGEDSTTTAVRPAVSSATADRLGKLSDRIATDLDAGDLCHAAHAADDLQTAVQESDLPANLRPGVDTVATDLVNQVNCPPPALPPEPEKKPKKPKKPTKPTKPTKPDDNAGDHGPGGEHGNGNGPGEGNGHGGFGPPGHAKLQGENG